MKIAELYAGIGGMRIAFSHAWEDLEVVFASEWDEEAQEVYKKNFNQTPSGELQQIDFSTVPSFDILTAHFYCSPFRYEKGVYLYDLTQFIASTRPKVILLENEGDSRILASFLSRLFYLPFQETFNAKDFGMPLDEKRTYTIAFWKGLPAGTFNFPYPCGKKILGSVLDKYQPSKCFLTQKQVDKFQSKGGELIKDYARKEEDYLYDPQGEKSQVRKLSPKEWARVMGYEGDIPKKDSSAWRLIKNMSFIPLVTLIAKEIKITLEGLEVE